MATMHIIQEYYD